MLGLECIVYMGEVDIERQALNVFRMKLLGAEVRPVSSGSRTLKDAINEAVRDWVTNVATTHYLIGSAVGMHPYPDHSARLPERHRPRSPRAVARAAGRLPDYVVACVGGGSNSIGIFHPFIEDTSVRLIGVEAAGQGIETGKHAATLVAGQRGHPPRLALLYAPERRRPGDRNAQHLARASTTPASAPSTAISRKQAAPPTSP